MSITHQAGGNRPEAAARPWHVAAQTSLQDHAARLHGPATGGCWNGRAEEHAHRLSHRPFLGPSNALFGEALSKSRGEVSARRRGRRATQKRLVGYLFPHSREHMRSLTRDRRPTQPGSSQVALRTPGKPRRSWYDIENGNQGLVAKNCVA